MGSRQNLINAMRARGGMSGIRGLRGVGRVFQADAAAGVGRVGGYKKIMPIQPGVVSIARGIPNSGTGYSAPPSADAARQFVGWVQSRFPILYSAAQKHTTGQTLRGLGQDTTTTAAPSSPSFFQTLLNTVTDLAPQYLQYKQQQDLLDVQLERAKRGLPPLTTGQYAPTVNVGLNADQAAAAWSAAKPWLIGGAAVLGGVLLLSALRRRGR